MDVYLSVDRNATYVAPRPGPNMGPNIEEGS
jgi:hypothetical protein